MHGMAFTMGNEIDNDTKRLDYNTVLKMVDCNGAGRNLLLIITIGYYRA